MPLVPSEQEAHRRISQAIKSKSRKLDLSGLSLVSVPRSIADLRELTSLNLSRNRLVQIPSAVFSLSKLTTLNLANNQLSTLPAQLIQLKELTNLNLEGNGFSSFPEQIWTLPALTSLRMGSAYQLSDIEELDLSDLGLEKVPPLLDRCNSLRSLSLRGNKLTLLEPSFIGLKSIEQLDLRQNAFINIPSVIWRLPGLRHLEMDDELDPETTVTLSLSGLGIERLTPLIKKFVVLRELDLSGNKFTALPMEVSHLSQLGRLNLSNNRLSTLPRELSRLTMLSSLDVRRNPMWPPPDFIWTMKSLTNFLVDVPSGQNILLDLSKQSLKVLSPCIGSFKGIKALKLGKNSLSEIPPEIEHLTELEELDLEGNELVRLPHQLEHLQALRVLNVKDNKLASLPAEIGRLTNLKVLNVDSNQLSEIPSELCGLVSLVTLSLEGNVLNSLPSEIGQLRNLTRLNLGGNTLEQVPARIGDLTNLISLNLKTNKLQALPPDIAKLGELKELDLSFNQFVEAPGFLGQLEQLTALALDSNSLAGLPEELSRLKNIATLTCQSNAFSEFPSVIESLGSLKELSVHNNQIKSLSHNINRLRNLTSLDLSRNKLTSLPPEIGGLRRLSELKLDGNELMSVPRNIGALSSLVYLNIGNNRLENLPAELGEIKPLESLLVHGNPLKDTLAIVANRGTTSLLAYLKSLLRDGMPLYEAKLVLIGEGNVGKTSLLSAMLQKPFIEGRPTTHGIEISTLVLPHPTLDQEIKLNVWDFGGQPVYRITHQFFYSQRSLYLVVWSPREGPEKNDVEGWLERIKLRAGDQATVLVVSTHRDTGQRVARIDETRFRRKFGDLIAGFYEIDSQTGHGIEELKSAIATAAARLPQMGDRLSLKWKEARDEVLALAEPQITFDAFCEICAKHKMGKEEFPILASLLHDLGDVVYFDDDESLSQVIVLQPEWLTKAIGFVLEDEQTNKSFGVLEHRRLAEIWLTHGIPGRERYEANCHPFFLRLMEKFDVSYRLEDGHSSLVSQLVPFPAPVVPWTDEVPSTLPQLKLVCLLSAQPPGLVPWLIVRTHRYTTDRHWLRGMFLDLPPHGEALLTLQDREFDIVVRGSNPSHFMSILQDTLERLVRQRWPGLEYKMAVPCPQTIAGVHCIGRLKLEVLLKRRANKLALITCPDCGDDLDIAQLLTGFGSKAEDPRNTIEKIKVLLDEESQHKQRQQDTKDEQAVHDINTLDPERASRAAQMLRSVFRAMRASTQDCPPLFTLVPEEPTLFSLINFNRVRHRLTLWCQYPDCEHPVSVIGSHGPGEYIFRRQQRWFMKIAPYTLLVARVLRTVAPLASANVKETLGEAYFRDAVLNLERMEAVTAEMLNLDVNELMNSAGSTNQLTRGEFSAMREYQELLRSVDPERKWGGLKRVEIPSGDSLWLCSKHYYVYEPGLPELGARRSDQFDVFLSHNSEDKEAVIEIGRALTKRGLRVWLDIWELKPGDVWQEALEGVIQSARSVLVLIGRDGFGPWELPEMRACIAEFVGRRLPVIPVLLPGVKTEPSLPLFLQQFSWVDLRRGLSSDGLLRLEWGITGNKPKELVR